MSAIEHPFTEGKTVALVNRYDWNVTFRRATVAKVHKTGRFLIEGFVSQWRASKTFGGEWYARPTSRYYGNDRVEEITDDLIESVQLTERRIQFGRIVDRLDKQRRYQIRALTAADLLILNEIAGRLEGNPTSEQSQSLVARSSASEAL